MDTIQALVWTGKQSFEERSFARPELAEGESLVRLSTATICGSDRHTVSGRRSQPCPSVLGHEGVGVVEETRSEQLAVGQRVTFSVTAPCMSCTRCAAGMSAKCHDLLKTGHEPTTGPWPISGTYASHILLRQHQAIAVVPDSLADAPAAIASCAGATVMAVVESAGSLVGKRVLVVGIGMLGLIAVEVAVRAGATVTALDPSTQRLGWAQELGPAVTTVTPEEFQGDTFDITLEFSGVQSGVETCIQNLDIGGTAVLAGSVADSPSVVFDPEWLVRGWRTITGVHNYEPRHLTQAVEFLAGSAIDWSVVLDPAISLDEVPAAFAAAAGHGLRTPVVLKD